MKVITQKLRAVIERATEIEVLLWGQTETLYVFENLDEDGEPCSYKVQNWECDDITDSIPNDTHKMIKEMLAKHHGVSR